MQRVRRFNDDQKAGRRIRSTSPGGPREGRRSLQPLMSRQEIFLAGAACAMAKQKKGRRRHRPWVFQCVSNGSQLTTLQGRSASSHEPGANPTATFTNVTSHLADCRLRYLPC
jgi:hypothetical protein